MRTASLQFLETLVNTPSPVGHETRGQRVWLDHVAAFADETFSDAYGNCVAVANKGGSPRIMLAAHADEIAMAVNHVTEAGYRVPGILRWPGHAAPGTVSAEPISNLDFLPTFCELAGVPVPADRPIDGTSLLPILAGKTLTRAHPLYWQYDRAISKPWTVALRDGPWKLLANSTLDQFELYNVVEDIGEKQNLASSETARLTRMTTALRKLHAEIQAEGARSGNPAPKAGGGK